MHLSPKHLLISSADSSADPRIVGSLHPGPLNRTIVSAEAVRCFSCTVKPPSRRKSAEIIGNNNEENGTIRSGEIGQRLCSKFDGSERFVVECPLSTLCKTRTFHLHTHRGRLDLYHLISQFMGKYGFNYSTSQLTIASLHTEKDHIAIQIKEPPPLPYSP